MRTIGDYDRILSAKPLAPFHDSVLAFFGDLSKSLVALRAHSDVATFGFWCRRASLLREKQNYDDLALRLGRGIVFHSTPSNVPVNFAFSFAAGLLAGNANIVRLPGTDFEQVRIITDAIGELLGGPHAALSSYLYFVRYASDPELHARFSSVCDVRVVWGGDESVDRMRRYPLKPRATELTFADRFSIAVIDARAYLRAPDKDRIALAFYNDTYFSDQNACTSPRVIYWRGEGSAEAKTEFWARMRDLVKQRYELAPVQAVGKLAAFYRAAADSVHGGSALRRTEMPDNYVVRVEAARPDDRLLHFRHDGGLFFEHDIADLKEILPVCGERAQTLVYYGLSREEIASFLASERPHGIDRAVPVGHSMDFSLIWDGHDLIRALSRRVMLP